jgi:hypothetical protein
MPSKEASWQAPSAVHPCDAYFGRSQPVSLSSFLRSSPAGVKAAGVSQAYPVEESVPSLLMDMQSIASTNPDLLVLLATHLAITAACFCGCIALDIFGIRPSIKFCMTI